MAITLAITNSKGGVGKTTTCANLGAALAAAGKRVLLVDNDPQGDLTKVMRADPKILKYTLANLMNAVLDDTEFELFADKAVIQREGIHYIPANSKLAAVSSRLVALQMSSRYRGGDSGGTPCEMVMASVLKYFQNRYDYILIDCGHSMDLLTINALAAADQAIVPVSQYDETQIDLGGAHHWASHAVPGALERLVGEGMKRTAVLLMLLCMLTVTASAAYVPEDVVSENRDGRQLIIKTYTLPPDADPSELIEEPFELEGYTYHHLETVKEEQAFKDSKAQTEVVTLETNTDDLAKILEQLAPTMEYNKDGYSGTLTLDHRGLQQGRSCHSSCPEAA